MNEYGEKTRFYVKVWVKFCIAMVSAAGWFGLSIYISQSWIRDLSEVVGVVPAWIIILFIALIPGFLNILLLVSILFDSPPTLNLNIEYPDVTILIAAYNEAENIFETFRGIKELDYPAGIRVVVVDDGSTEGTLEKLSEVQFEENNRSLQIVKAEHQGKSHALNAGLKFVKTDIFVTIDADTFLHPQALQRIIARFISDPVYTAAVAGCVLVRNSRATFITKMQEWDYFAAIASVKRQQGLYQGTLVAQGAFSAFKTWEVKGQLGWPSVVGEDIVLTWALLKSGRRIGFEPTAVGFTLAPFKLSGFYRQRKRWARGMIEGIKRHGDLAWRRKKFSSFFVAVDFLFPFLDSFYTLAFIPGIVLACFGYFYIVGPLTLLVLPITFFIVWVMYRKQKKIFNLLGLTVRKNRMGLLFYVFFYQLIMSPICVIGYFQEVFGLRKKW